MKVHYDTTVSQRLNTERFQTTLAAIEECDMKLPPDYANRAWLVYRAVSLALMLGMSAGFAIDPKEPDWPVAYIDLPTGQVSWHMPKYPGEWDGHSTEEKYRRCRDYWEAKGS